MRKPELSGTCEHTHRRNDHVFSQSMAKGGRAVHDTRMSACMRNAAVYGTSALAFRECHGVVENALQASLFAEDVERALRDDGREGGALVQVRGT